MPVGVIAGLCCLVVAAGGVVALVILVLFIAGRKRRHYSIDTEALERRGAHRMDFVILAKEGSEHLIKYELDSQKGGENSHEVCVIWDSPDGGKWELAGTFTGPRQDICTEISQDISRLTPRGFKADYRGNGKLLADVPKDA